METLTPKWISYELVDSGGGVKLERFGNFVLVRPEPQAKWMAKLPKERWHAADAEFVKSKAGEQGKWKLRKAIPARWDMQWNALRFWVQPAPSGHVGVFPDQACHWEWVGEVVRRAARPVKVLSLFGYTGLATLAAAAAGAEVTHVDASRKAVTSARENQRLSGLSERRVRWIVEDALTFVQREGRRGGRYDGIMLDPPRFGRGPDGEIWKLEESLAELLAACGKLLSESPVFLLLNVYTTVLTRTRVENEAERLHAFLKNMTTKAQDTVTVNVGETGVEDGAGRRVSGAVFARAEFIKVV